MPKQNREERHVRRAKEQRELDQLEAKLSEGIKAEDVKRFADLPLSARTQGGLKAANFITPTKIQTDALARALLGKDVLGAAKTGSGKTLAFLIPIIEKLYRMNWSKFDGVGAVIISPTRELALQTFTCLTKIGCKHEFSAGLVVGGSTLSREQAVVTSTNIIVCTPGRLLQHMDETPNFSCDNLQVLVLDEADRILDLGFREALDAILANLPPQRQTLLFSATQTASVSDLARLSLQKPEYISVHQKSKSSTPSKLVQAYIIVDLDKKLDVLFSFLRTHTQCKVLVFVSSCKQVRFLYESFRRMRPGAPLMQLFGKQKLPKRVAIFNDFSKKQAAVLFATDIAARGLDIPAVHWVVQVDCPEDVETYIHRVGRTARFDKDGKALLFLTPSERKFVQLLEEKRVPITETEANASRLQSISGRLQSLNAEDPNLKYLAQKSFISYMRSIFLQSDKDVFKVDELPADAYAIALGLPIAPKIKFLRKTQKVMGKRKPQKVVSDDENEDGVEKDDAPESKFDRLRRRTNQDVLSTAFTKLRGAGEVDDDDDAGGLLQLAPVQRHSALEAGDEAADSNAEGLPPRPKSRKERLKKPTAVSVRKAALEGRGERVVFGDDGTPIVQGPKLAGLDVSSSSVKNLVFARKHEELEEAARDMSKADVIDREMYKERLRAKRREKRSKLRALRVPDGFEEGFGGVQLANNPSDDEQGYSDASSDDERGRRSPGDVLDTDFALLDEMTQEEPPMPREKKGKRPTSASTVNLLRESESDVPAKKQKPLRSLEEEALGLLAQK